MSEADMFTNLLKGLQGVTVLAAPRISRETIIGTLREHTFLLKSLKQEIGGVATSMNALAHQAADNRHAIDTLVGNSKKIMLDLETLTSSTLVMRAELNTLSDQVQDLEFLKQQFSEQKKAVTNLSEKLNDHVIEITEYQATTAHVLVSVETKCNETQFQMKVLQDYVDHIGDNLILPSSQIAVETSAGFGNVPLTLLDALIRCSSNFEEAAKVAADQDARIFENADNLGKKADQVDVGFKINTLEKKVEKIEYHVIEQRQQGIDAIRDQCMALGNDVANVFRELSDKVNKHTVGQLVHDKYEEIVRYLQDALQSSAEDENNFKAKADELQEMIEKLAHSKVDRYEITPMQDILVKSEAMLKKIGMQQKSEGKGGSKESFTKKEIEALLELKVDKSEFDQQVQSALKGSTKKMSRKLAAISMSNDSGLLSGSSSIYGHELPPDSAMWKGLADSMKSDSDNAVMRSVGARQLAEITSTSVGANNMGVMGNMMLSADLLLQQATALRRRSPAVVGLGMSFPTNNAPGVFKSATESGRPGGAVLAPSFSVQGSSNAKAHQTTHTSTSLVPSASSSVGTTHASPASSVAAGANYQLSPSHSVVSFMDPPSGLSSSSSSVTGGVGGGGQAYPHVPPEITGIVSPIHKKTRGGMAAMTSDRDRDSDQDSVATSLSAAASLSLGAAVQSALSGAGAVGAGFSLRIPRVGAGPASSLRSSLNMSRPTTAGASLAAFSDDIDPGGFMLQGEDGHLYITDDEPVLTSCETPVKPTPTSKPVNFQKRIK